MKDRVDYDRLEMVRKRLNKLYPVRNREFSEEFRKALKEFGAFVFELHRYRDKTMVYNLPKKEIAFFQRFFCDYETIYEKRSAAALIEGKISAQTILKGGILKKTFDYSLLEGKMADIKGHDSVLIIGSGPFPETAIGYALTFGCKVVCLEKERNYAALSKKVITVLKLTDRVKVVHGSIGDVDLDSFDKILVTVLTKPKDKVLKSLEHSKADIIARTVFGPNVLIYEPIAPKALKSFKIKAGLTRWGKNFNSSLLLQAKDT